MYNQLLLPLPIVLPVVAGILIRALKLEDKKKRQTFVAAVTIVNMVLTIVTLLLAKGQTLQLVRISDQISFALHIDDLSIVFGALVAILWVPTTFYAFGYMSHEGDEVKFFAWFTAVMGIAIGLAFAANILTFYLFYEFLTLFTFPLLTHAGTKEAMAAGKKYLIYSFIGATLAFLSAVVLQAYSSGAMFQYGGTLDTGKAAGNPLLLQIMYLVGFMGFGVKAAVLPVHDWLPSAYVAPTPVTALLHAVAVVKAGVFGVMRLTYFGYGADFLRGSWVQYVTMALALCTILYGSGMALRTKHLKKRLAYSTIGQLSYILFAAALMTPTGLQAGLMHMVFHGIIKIVLFLCCGSVMFMTQKTEIAEMTGLGKSMPLTWGCMFVAALGLVGLPPTAGLISKWYLITTAFSSGSMVQGLVGIVVLMASTMLSALYLLPLCVKAFFPGRDFVADELIKRDPPRVMSISVLIITIAVVVLGVFPGLVTGFMTQIGAVM